jgi:plasmid stabilization system protein ParE
MAGYGEDFAVRQSALIWDAAEMLGQFPFMGSPSHDPNEQRPRNERRFFVPHTSYFIYYRVDEDVVHITSIMYAPLSELSAS